MNRLGIVLVVTGIVLMMAPPSFGVKADTPLLDVKQVWYVNKSPFLLEGKAEPGSQVSIEGQNLFTNVGDDGKFKFELDIVEGVNVFVVISSKVGAVESKTIMVEMDSTPPEVTLIVDGKPTLENHINIQLFDAKEFELDGFIEPKCTIWDDNNTCIYKNTKFTAHFKLSKTPSMTRHVLEIIDRYGNFEKIEIECLNIHKRTSKLKIGSKTINTDGEDFTANEPVQMINGSTMLDITAFPYSIIPESTITVAKNSLYLVAGTHVFMFTIGSNIASFDSKQIHLDTPPKVIDDDVLVPLRIICDNYGININYDPKTKDMTLTRDVYPFGYKEGK